MPLTASGPRTWCSPSLAATWCTHLSAEPLRAGAAGLRIHTGAAAQPGCVLACPGLPAVMRTSDCWPAGGLQSPRRMTCLLAVPSAALDPSDPRRRRDARRAQASTGDGPPAARPAAGRGVCYAADHGRHQGRAHRPCGGAAQPYPESTEDAPAQRLRCRGLCLRCRRRVAALALRGVGCSCACSAAGRPLQRSPWAGASSALSG